MQTLSAHNYNIYIGDDVFSHLQAYLTSSSYNADNVFILTDENTLQHCLPLLIAEVPFLANSEILEIDSGEESKNIEILSALADTMASMNADRKSLLINLGGGVIGDLGGLLASLYKRGIDFINLPTSLLAQVDASVGGKLAINLNHLKNILGVFNNPVAVYISPLFINTLPEKEIISGYAEMLKHGLVANHLHFNELIKKHPLENEDWSVLIAASVEIKNKIVSNDPKEKNVRKFLNFGHTIGHAIESFYLDNAKVITHGEAIAAGIICESYLSCKSGVLKVEELDKIVQVIKAIYQPLQFVSEDFDALINYMNNDKKNEKGLINFTFLDKIGSASINHTADELQIKEALQFYITL
jgi:3-dehydroquinate synthase